MNVAERLLEQHRHEDAKVGGVGLVFVRAGVVARLSWLLRRHHRNLLAVVVRDADECPERTSAGKRLDFDTDARR